MPNFHKSRVAGRVIKTLVALFVLAVNAVLIWRVFFSANIPKELRTLAVNEHTLAAYEQYGDELILQNQNTYSTTYGEGNVGYFTVAECVFIPQAEQVQVVVRYNNSTLKHLQQDYALSELPEKSGHWFDFSLVRSTDITPEDDSDDHLAEALSYDRCKPTEGYRAETSLYTYYRLVFDGVTVEEYTDGVFLDVYYVGDVNYELDAYGTLCLYDCRMKWIGQKLTADDKKALSRNHFAITQENNTSAVTKASTLQ